MKFKKHVVWYYAEPYDGGFYNGHSRFWFKTRAECEAFIKRNSSYIDYDDFQTEEMYWNAFEYEADEYEYDYFGELRTTDRNVKETRIN